jgi:hypothetical protein
MATTRQADLLHARCYLAVLKAADRLFVRDDDGARESIARLDREWINIIKAQRRARARLEYDDDAPELCSRFADAGRQVIAFRLTPPERVEWLHAARSGARHCGDTWGEIVHIGNLASAYTRLGHPARAIECWIRGCS